MKSMNTLRSLLPTLFLGSLVIITTACGGEGFLGSSGKVKTPDPSRDKIEMDQKTDGSDDSKSGDVKAKDKNSLGTDGKNAQNGTDTKQSTGGNGDPTTIQLPGGSGNGTDGHNGSNSSVGNDHEHSTGQQSSSNDGNGGGIVLNPATGSNSDIPVGANGQAGPANQNPNVGNSTPINPAGGSPGTPAPTQPQTPEQILAHACATKQVQTRTVAIKFAKNTTQSCPFVEKNGNETMKAGKLRARLEWTRSLGIPANHMVCSMDASSPSQKMRYDDHLFLMLNNRVILSRATAVNALQNDSKGFKRYDWLQLRNQDTGDRSSPYCPSGVSCEVPKTENTGKIGFKFNDDARNRLFGSLIGQTLEFKLVVTGDDNPDTDCMFDRDLDLSVTYTYVQ